MYKYAVVLIGIAAVVEIIVAGITWTLQMSGEESITSAKKKIANGIIGLVIAVGSYTLLYTINPNLVQFKGLRIKFIEKEEYLPELGGELAEEDFAGSTTEKPPWKPGKDTSFRCEVEGIGKAYGVVPVAATQRYKCPIGVTGSFTVLPELKEKICKVGEILAAQGYGISIAASYRSFADQKKIYCDRKAAGGGGAAVPGYSNHGQGRAIDAHLTDRNGGRVYQDLGKTEPHKTQCQVDEKYMTILAKAFIQVGFNRLKSEFWHFEYGTKLSKSVGDYRGKPESCL